jgi:hypothetical protein
MIRRYPLGDLISIRGQREELVAQEGSSASGGAAGRTYTPPLYHSATLPGVRLGQRGIHHGAVMLAHGLWQSVARGHGDVHAHR